MKHREGRVLEALHSVQVFLDSHGEALASINDSGARKTLDEIVAELETHAVQQDGGKRKAPWWPPRRRSDAAECLSSRGAVGDEGSCLVVLVAGHAAG